MTLVLDASMALAWHILRSDPDEAALARAALEQIEADGASVPALWFAEIANALLVAERRGSSTQKATASFLADLAQMPIEMDIASPSSLIGTLVDLGRRWNISGYDANYLELALRTRATLATFDRRLAAAARTAGVKVFGDPT